MDKDTLFYMIVVRADRRRIECLSDLEDAQLEVLAVISESGVMTMNMLLSFMSRIHRRTDDKHCLKSMIMKVESKRRRLQRVESAASAIPPTRRSLRAERDVNL